MHVYSFTHSLIRINDDITQINGRWRRKRTKLLSFYFLELYFTWIGAQYLIKSQNCQGKHRDTHPKLVIQPHNNENGGNHMRRKCVKNWQKKAAAREKNEWNKQIEFGWVLWVQHVCTYTQEFIRPDRRVQTEWQIHSRKNNNTKV